MDETRPYTPELQRCQLINDGEASTQIVSSGGSECSLFGLRSDLLALSDFCGVELGIRKAGDSRELRHPARHSPAILFIFSAKLFAQRRLLVKHNKKMEEQPETRICWNHGGLATQDNFRNLPVKSISGGRVLRNLLSGFKANS